jgi:outer membrane immunogenic protein
MHGQFGGSQSDSMSRFLNAGGGYTDSVTYTSTSSMNISDMATARLRAGYAYGSFLPYVFGGAALGRADIVRTARIFGDQVNSSAPAPFNDVPFDISATDAKNSHFIYGYSGGLGVDMMLMSCLFLRVEWEYLRFTSSIDTDINTFRAGLGYKF